MKPEDTDNRLLFMACSATKLPHAEQPRRLYLGPMWQTLRTHRGDLPWRCVMVLSGRFGFISAETFIQTYEERLTREKADYLIRRGIRAGNDHFGQSTGPGCCALDTLILPGHRGRPPFERIMIAGGGDYRRVFSAFVSEFIRAGAIAAHADIRETHGGIGEQRQQLGGWLREKAQTGSAQAHEGMAAPA